VMYPGDQVSGANSSSKELDGTWFHVHEGSTILVVQWESRLICVLGPEIWTWRLHLLGSPTNKARFEPVCCF
jgi:hypothetical protein